MYVICVCHVCMHVCSQSCGVTQCVSAFDVTRCVQSLRDASAVQSLRVGTAVQSLEDDSCSISGVWQLVHLWEMTWEPRNELHLWEFSLVDEAAVQSLRDGLFDAWAMGHALEMIQLLATALQYPRVATISWR